MLVSRIGTKWTVTLGLIVLGASVGSLAVLDTTTAYWVVGAALVAFGIGGANTMAPATDAVMAALPDSKAGVGSALNDTTRQIGGALGVGVFGSMLNSIYSSNVTFAVSELSGEMAAAAKNSVGAALQVATSLEAAAGQSLVSAANNAFVDAGQVVFIVGGAVSILGAAVALRYLPATDLGDPVEAELGPVLTEAVPEPVAVRIDEG